MIPWARSTEFYNNLDNSHGPTALFGNSATGVYEGVDGASIMSTFGYGLFLPYDLKPLGVSPDAKFAQLGGILIITGAADLFLAFRAPGSTTIPTWRYYQEQLLSADPSLGERSVCYDTVPLVNGVFECAVMVQNYPDNGAIPYPGGPNSVGWNISLKGWGR